MKRNAVQLAMVLLVGALALSACKKDEQTTEQPAQTTQEVAKEAPAAEQSATEQPAGEQPVAEPVAQDPNSAEAKAGEDQQYWLVFGLS